MVDSVSKGLKQKSYCILNVKSHFRFPWRGIKIKENGEDLAVIWNQVHGCMYKQVKQGMELKTWNSDKCVGSKRNCRTWTWIIQQLCVRENMNKKINDNLCTKRKDCIEKAMKHFSTSTVEKSWKLSFGHSKGTRAQTMNDLKKHMNQWTTFDLRKLEFIFLLSSNWLKTLMKKIKHNNSSTSYINDHIFSCLFPPINLQPIPHLEAASAPLYISQLAIYTLNLDHNILLTLFSHHFIDTPQLIRNRLVQNPPRHCPLDTAATCPGSLLPSLPRPSFPPLHNPPPAPAPEPHQGSIRLPRTPTTPSLPPTTPSARHCSQPLRAARGP
ncbi:hypothetical protein VP01_290g5 [Puccinia sorghi]|uniref:Uncharacterized protein n=1 Tax=Puccinia sorghi TaxID=27349 RepID=A0A0L6V1F9_9BASI|nr:hypothetical protein VP01_290g5 [Puccinia sorghi]